MRHHLPFVCDVAVLTTHAGMALSFAARMHTFLLVRGI